MQILARYSPVRVALAGLFAVVVTWACWRFLVDHGSFVRLARSIPEGLSLLMMLGLTCWVWLVVLTALHRIITNDGAAVWIDDGRLYWGVLGRSLDVAAITAAAHWRERLNYLAVQVRLDPGGLRIIPATLLAGGPGALLHNIWSIRLGLEAVSAPIDRAEF